MSRAVWYGCVGGAGLLVFQTQDNHGGTCRVSEPCWCRDDRNRCQYVAECRVLPDNSTLVCSLELDTFEMIEDCLHHLESFPVDSWFSCWLSSTKCSPCLLLAVLILNTCTVVIVNTRDQLVLANLNVEHKDRLLSHQ